MAGFYKVVNAWLRDEDSNIRIYYALLFLLLMSPILFVWAGPIYSDIVSDIEPIDYNTHKRNAHGPANKTFSIYAQSSHSAKRLVDFLYADARIAKSFGLIVAQWRHQNLTDLAVLQSHKYNLIIAHVNHIERPEVQGITGYKPIASYKYYNTSLIAAKDELIELTTQYFAGKRIGLRDSPLSQSGHIIPLQALHEAGIDKHLIDIIYYKEHKQLRDALSTGKVDVIGSYWTEQDIKKYGDLPRVDLKPSAISKWYLLPSPSDVECAVTDALTKLKQTAKKDYFRDLDIAPVCVREKT